MKAQLKNLCTLTLTYSLLVGLAGGPALAKGVAPAKAARPTLNTNERITTSPTAANSSPDQPKTVTALKPALQVPK